MGFEKDGSSKSGFFQIFDWTAKSRKKLFSIKSDFPENFKQGKRNCGNFPTTSLSLIDDDDYDDDIEEIRIGSTSRGDGEFRCASSVTDEEGFGSRAPSVVARLMGLDSLPNSNFQDPYATPFYDNRSLQDAHYHRKNYEYYNDHQSSYGGSVLKKSNGQSSRSFVEPKPKKPTPSRPIEKFQSEILPPKSAKSIPVTQHRLLSPIKSPGFVPSSNAAYIMEAAAKIIEPGLQYPARAKMPLFVGSSSVPLKVQALREKVEGTQRAKVISASLEKVEETRVKVDTSHKTFSSAESSNAAAKYLKGQPMTKSWNGSGDTPFRSSLDTVEGSSSSSPVSKNKGKSISLAIQAKVNVQKRVSERQQISDAKASQTIRSQQPNNTQKASQKKSYAQNQSGVLRQNNQKQNSQVEKDNSASKPLVSNSQSRKLPLRDSSSRQKASIRSNGKSKTGLRKTSLSGDSSEMDAPYSNANSLHRRKRSMDSDLRLNKNPSNGKSPSIRNPKPAKAGPVTDAYNWSEESRRKGTDVVSFTFTAPLTRSLPGSSEDMKHSSLGYNVLGGDALSQLLEEKLRELTFGLESSTSRKVEKTIPSIESSTSRKVEKAIPSIESSTPTMENKRDQLFSTDNYNIPRFEFEFSSSVINSNSNFQGVSEMDESSNGYFEAGKFQTFRHPSPISILEPSFSIESCESTISTDSNTPEGSKLCSTVQRLSNDVNASNFVTELSDSASSFPNDYLAKPTGWELEYVKEILSTVDLMFNDFASGHSRDILNPHLFNLLETRKKKPLESDEGVTWVRRKVLFDCVIECLDSRAKICVGGGYTAWAKGVTMVTRKEHLAKEICAEILGVERLSDSMVDELVDKDMSSRYGKWLDFEVEGFGLGVDLEALIFDSLIDDLVADVFSS